MEKENVTRSDIEKAAMKAAMETLEDKNLSAEERADIFCKYVSAALSVVKM